MSSDLFGIPIQVILGQLLLGLLNGGFYALLSLGLAVIHGLCHLGHSGHESKGFLEVIELKFTLQGQAILFQNPAL